eukprot:4554468-Prymnesium_polylepis.1
MSDDALQAPLDLPRCTLLGGTFAMLVQVGLGVAAVATLLYKRMSERPQRQWIVWFFDASKQAWAGALQHLVNMAFGVYFAAGSGASECAWYLTNFAISIFCGIFLLWAAMKAYRRVVEHYQLVLLRSGEYGNPPSWQPWLAQLVVWGFISAAEKVITAVVIILPLHGMLDGFALWMEQPF